MHPGGAFGNGEIASFGAWRIAIFVRNGWEEAEGGGGGGGSDGQGSLALKGDQTEEREPFLNKGYDI